MYSHSPLSYFNSFQMYREVKLSTDSQLSTVTVIHLTTPQIYLGATWMMTPSSLEITALNPFFKNLIYCDMSKTSVLCSVVLINVICEKFRIKANKHSKNQYSEYLFSFLYDIKFVVTANNIMPSSCRAASSHHCGW